MAAAAAVAEALATGGRWLLDAALAEVAARVAGADRCAPWPADERLVAAPPRILPAVATAPASGADNRRVAATLGVPLP